MDREDPQAEAAEGAGHQRHRPRRRGMDAIGLDGRTGREAPEPEAAEEEGAGAGAEADQAGAAGAPAG